jgi:hypothetical protein
MRSFLAVLLLAAAFAIATVVLGWWSVPIVAAAGAVVRRGIPRTVWMAALAAALAWAALLAWLAARGPLGVLATQLAGVMTLPAVVLPLVTVIFPALLAWSAAQLTSVAVARRSVPRA